MIILNLCKKLEIKVNNKDDITSIIKDIKIYLWTGYEFDKIRDSADSHLKYILEEIDCIIDGPYIDSLRDTTLHMRGSSNQKIIHLV